MTTQERWLESYPFLTPRAGINKSNLYGVARAAIWGRVSNIAAVTEAASIPDEDLQPIALRVAEQEQVPAQGLARQSIPDQTVQPFEPLAPVGDPGGQIDPCGWTQSKHRLHPLQYTHQALERTRIKIRMYSMRRPPRSTTASPQVASCGGGDFLASNSTFTNRPAGETGLRLFSNAVSSDGDPVC